MHRLRSSLRAREEGAPARPLSLEERRREAPAALPDELPYGERRVSTERRAERHSGIIERAVIVYRGKRALVPVANVSEGGVTVETGLTLEVGETLTLELPGKDSVETEVRWTKGRRVGLKLTI